MKTDPIEMYREAARRIEDVENMYCCCALADQGAPQEVHDYFAQIFKPEAEEGDSGCWWHDFDSEPRILALLLCAEICERQDF